MSELLRIEEAALNAWPGLQTVLLDGWVARFANGYTKRANSVTPLYALPTAETLAERVALCADLYGRQRQPLIFRLPSICADAAALDALLAEQGYRLFDRTLVQVLDLTSAETGSDHACQLLHGAAGRDQWLDVFHRLSPSRKDLATHRQLLQTMTGAVAPLVLQLDGTMVACGLGVVERGCLGIFDLVVTAEMRRQGLGRRLMTALLAWGQAQGATIAYLQVMADNQAAQALYQQMRFQPAYDYWYRVAA